MVGGIIQLNETWERWDMGSEGSNYGKDSITHKEVKYYSAIQLVENAYRRIFFSDYYGVSWVIPRVAAKAGLLLHRVPIAYTNQLIDILINTSIKINQNQYNYTSKPFPEWKKGWNCEVGYGKPSINAAIELAVEQFSEFK
jgi:hypothetical protein